jgi:hypothetical protein
MRIDCDSLDFGLECYDPSSLEERNRLKSSKLVKDLLKINNKMEPRRNYMVISMNVFNLLEYHDRFEHIKLSSKKEIGPLTLVGYIGGLDCYVDLNMKHNNILLHYDKQVIRNLRLESILDDSNIIDDEVEIEVII